MRPGGGAAIGDVLMAGTATAPGRIRVGDQGPSRSRAQNASRIVNAIVLGSSRKPRIM
jgi:hypothetical protein